MRNAGWLHCKAHTKIGKNKTCREVFRYVTLWGRRKGLSINDLARAWGRSTRTIHKALSPTVHYRAWDIMRVRRGNGRVDLKGKISVVVQRCAQWFRYVILSGFDDVARILEAVENGERPP